MYAQSANMYRYIGRYYACIYICIDLRDNNNNNNSNNNNNNNNNKNNIPYFYISYIISLYIYIVSSNLD